MTEKKHEQQQRWIELIAATKQLEVIAEQFDRVTKLLQSLRATIEKHAVTFPDEQISLEKIQRYLVSLRRQLLTKSEHIKAQVQQERDRHRAWVARQLTARSKR